MTTEHFEITGSLHAGNARIGIHISAIYVENRPDCQWFEHTILRAIEVVIRGFEVNHVVYPKTGDKFKQCW